MKSLSLFITAAALILQGVAVRAQGSGPAPSQSTPSTANVPTVLTLPDAIKLAIERNYTVRQEANNARRAGIEVTRSRDNMWLPTVGASGSWGYSYSLTPLSERTQNIILSQAGLVQTVNGDTLGIRGVATNAPTTQVITPAGSHDLRWNASVNENIFNGFSDIARVHASEASLASSQDLSLWSRQQIAYTVTSDYLNVLRTGELVDAATTTLQEAVAQLSLIRGKYEAGVVPIGQVYQQEAVVGQDSLGLIDARNNYENARADALFQLNIPPNEYRQYGFSQTGVDTVITPYNPSDTNISNSHIDAVINARPDIRAQVAAIAVKEYAIDGTRGSYWPSLDASAGVGGGGSNTDISKIQVQNQFSLGLSVSLNIFNRMQDKLLIDEEQIDVENARITLEQDVQQLRSDAAKAVNNLQSSEQALAASDIAARSAEESLRLATERLRVGAGTQVDVIVAESQVETARTNRVNARYNYFLAKQQLAYTLGEWNY